MNYISSWWLQIFFIFTPNLGEEDFHFDSSIFFFRWVVQPPNSIVGS